MRSLLPLILAAAGVLQAAKPLEIYFIDTEGGQSTLVVSPSGQTLLIDTGYAGFSGRDADRIALAAKKAKIKRIDFLLITHNHADHIGGVSNLLERLPVGEFLDHGPSVEEDNKYPEAYAAVLAKGGEHKVVQAGDTIPIKGLDVTVVVSNAKHIANAGTPNPYCEGLKPEAGETGENPQSAGILIQLGKFRFLDPGDIIYNEELALECPENHAGKVDLYLTAHHGTHLSPKSVWGLQPRVILMDNGPRKGGDPKEYKLLRGTPGLEDLWQLHFSMEGGGDGNTPDSFIANVDEHGTGQYLMVTAEPTGAFTVYNPRNKFTKTYAAK